MITWKEKRRKNNKIINKKLGWVVSWVKGDLAVVLNRSSVS